MSLKILYVAATSTEADTLKKLRDLKSINDSYRIGNMEFSLLITGIGSVSTAWSMQKWLSVHERPDLIINVGIAGSFRDEIPIGEVVVPFADCFADAGIEDGDNFMTLNEAGLSDPDEFPYKDGWLRADEKLIMRLKDIVRPVSAITVNTATGSEITRNKLLKKYNPDIETMEGATFFYICIREKLAFLALRSISNRVETRNRNNWNIPLALENLSEKLSEIIYRLE